MKRRAFLGSFGAVTVGLSGCLGSALFGATDEITVKKSSSEAPGLTWTVEKLSRSTEDNPFSLRIALKNDGPTRDLTVEGGLPYPITPGKTTGDEDVDVLPAIMPVDSDYERRFSRECWQAPLDDPQFADDTPWAWGYKRNTHTLEAGEKIEETYHLVSIRTSECFPPGEYRFDRYYELEGKEYRWDFTLDVPSGSSDA